MRAQLEEAHDQLDHFQQLADDAQVQPPSCRACLCSGRSALCERRMRVWHPPLHGAHAPHSSASGCTR